MRPISNIQVEYGDTLARAKTVAALIAQHEKDLLALQNEWTELQGSSWNRRDGKLTKLKMELAKAKLFEDDKDATPVVWVEGIEKRTPPKEGYIVDKVTPKRIYIRQRGESHTTQYKRNGECVGSCYYTPFIDVEATLKNFTGKVPPCK